jgi:hypothetical protein
MTHLTIEVHGDCTVIADRSPALGKTHGHYEPIIIESKSFDAKQIADAVRASLVSEQRRGRRFVV